VCLWAGVFLGFLPNGTGGGLGAPGGGFSFVFVFAFCLRLGSTLAWVSFLRTTGAVGSEEEIVTVWFFCEGLLLFSFPFC